ncbi:MAG: hypothetical protein WA712_03590, partial [Pseudolabrys sp.]
LLHMGILPIGNRPDEQYLHTAESLSTTTRRSDQSPSMIAIILSACLVGDPGVCRDHRVSLAPEISVIQCMKNASAFLAQWSDENPVGAWCAGSAAR